MCPACLHLLPGSLCLHNRQRSKCRDCGGGNICEHSRVRSKCRDCGGGSICEHSRERSACKECGGKSICQHSRLRSVQGVRRKRHLSAWAAEIKDGEDSTDGTNCSRCFAHIDDIVPPRLLLRTKAAMLLVEFTVLVIAIVLVAPWLSSTQPLTSPTSPALTGKLVVVTGSTSGVGLEAARNFAGRGAKLIITSRSSSRASAVAADLPGNGHVGHALDLSSFSSVSNFSSVLNSLGKIDVLVLNAGTVYGPDFTGPFTTSSYPGGKVDTMIASNHLGHYKLLKDTFDLIVTRSEHQLCVVKL